MQKNIFYKFSITVAAVAMLVLSGGCKKFLEPDSKTQVGTGLVFASDANAVAAINGLYAKLGTGTQVNGLMTQIAGFMADEIKYNIGGTNEQFMNNQVLGDNATASGFWDFYYATIFQANSIIENATASTGMTDAYKKQIVGESKFVRALCHFYLVNLYGPVPVITVTDKDKTIFAPRNSEDEVYAQIKTDLMDAFNALPADYSVSNGSRIRVNKWGAAALLARVYLYTKEYTNAETQATAVLANTGLYELLSNQNNVFLINQKESILEWDRTQFTTTYEGGMFLGYPSYGLVADHAMLPGLLSAFENGDTRVTNWQKTYGSYTLPYKYRSVGTTVRTENYLVLRVAEQYLIRAEARVQQNNLSGAQADLNRIRNRSGLANDTTMVNKEKAMAAIEHERQTELFCEWGHRWFDLKRWPSLTSPATKTRADDVLGALKNTWTSTAVLLPIPQLYRDRNPNLTQNEGY